ncbi:MAG: WYL domain-containing protein [Colwellia sp.]|nr:WYL domain-containing protein [Colwellia sp.]
MSNLKTQRQEERLKYIDLCAYVMGFVNRKILMNRFDVKEAWATNDFKTYQVRSNEGLIYDHGLKAYKPIDSFIPIFKHESSTAIQLLSNGSQTIVCEPSFASKSYSCIIPTVVLKLNTIYPILRAISLNKQVEIEYFSRSTGKTKRKLSPHSLIKTGCFVYVRAFDHKEDEHRTFKLSRVFTAQFVNQKPEAHETIEMDNDWNTQVKLTIGINSNGIEKETIKFDYGFESDSIEIELKKAIVPFFLMDWNIAPINYPKLPVTLFPLKEINNQDV